MRVCTTVVLQKMNIPIECVQQHSLQCLPVCLSAIALETISGTMKAARFRELFRVPGPAVLIHHQKCSQKRHEFTVFHLTGAIRTKTMRQEHEEED